jgi:hyperosmotically inducible protein
MRLSDGIEMPTFLAGTVLDKQPVPLTARLKEIRMKSVMSALCLSIAFGLAAPVWAQSSTDMANAPSAQPGTDGWITTKVKAELMETKGISSFDISVTTNNGVVTLSGNVDSKAQVQKAVALAKGVKGVHDVDSSALKSKNN